MFNPGDYQWEKAVSTELEVGDIVVFGLPINETYYYQIVGKFGDRYVYQEAYYSPQKSFSWGRHHDTHLSGFNHTELRKAIRCVPYDPTQEPSEEGDI